MKQVLKYPGSKWRIADQLVNLIPEHHTYCEPFFGSGAVFFRKPPSDIELINDLDNNIPTLFRCIRDDPERLARIIAVIPYSRFEYERAFSTDNETDDFTRATNAEHSGLRTEVVWMNYDRQYTMSEFQQQKLF